MKNCKLKRIAVLSMVLLMAIGSVGCKKSENLADTIRDAVKDEIKNEINSVINGESKEDSASLDNSSKEDNDTGSGFLDFLGGLGVVTSSKLTEFNIHGFNFDVTKYTEKLKFENLKDNWYEDMLKDALSEWDEHGMRIAQFMTTNKTMSIYNDFEFSEKTQENLDIFRGVAFNPYQQREEGAVYGIQFRLNSNKINDEKPNLDFKFANGITDKALAADYEKNKDFFPVIGPIARANDVYKMDLNKMFTECGKAYMAIYLDGKAVDIASYRAETEDLIRRFREEEDGFSILKNAFSSLVNRESILNDLSRMLTPMTMELPLEQHHVNKDTVYYIRESEVAGIAGVRSAEKLLTGEAKEMVIIIAEESYNGISRKLSAEDIKNGEENMNIYYLYLTK